MLSVRPTAVQRMAQNNQRFTRALHSVKLINIAPAWTPKNTCIDDSIQPKTYHNFCSTLYFSNTTELML